MCKKIVNLCFVLVLIGGGLGISPSSAQAQEPLPVFHIAPDRGYACGAFWEIGEVVVLSIKEGENDVIDPLSETAVPAGWDNSVGEVCFGFEPGLVQPGMTASMADDEITKDISIVGLSFDAVDASGIASGTGPPGESANLCLDWGSECLTVTIDPSGNWSGPLPGYDPITSDLSTAHIKIGDEDWDELVAYLPQEEPPPMPMFTVQPEHGWVGGWGWPVDVEISLVVDDDLNPDNGVLFSTTAMSFESEWEEGVGEIFFELWEQEAHLDPGNYVSVSVGTITKVTQIVSLTFDAVSGTGLASGIGPDSGEGHACLDFADDGYCEPITLASGVWTADFSGYGLNINELIDAHVVVYDEDWDETMAHLPPAPTIDFHTSYNWLDIDHFPAFSPVEVEIYAESTITEILFTDDSGHIGWDVMTSLAPGTLIRVEFGEGEIVKELVVENLSVDFFDYESDLAGGAADEDTLIHFVLEGPEIYLEDQIYAGSAGWMIDFWLDYGIDLQQEMGFWVYTEDEDGDRNKAELIGEEPSPDPMFTVHPQHNWVGGWGWPVDVEVFLVIDDDLNPDNGNLFFTTTMSFESEWEEGVGEIFFDLWDQSDYLTPGNFVIVGVGEIIKVTQIIPLTFDEVTETGLASGLGPLSGEGHACLDFDSGSFCEGITITPAGWTADFSSYGLNIADLRDAHVVVYDEDWDETMASLEIPPEPFMRVNVTEQHILALGWPLESFLTLTIDDPGTTISVDCGFSADVEGYAPWDPGLTMVEFDTSGCEVQPGFFVRVVGADITKEHLVTGLTIDAVDLELNTATGSTGQLTWVDILAIGVENEYLSIKSGTDGIWTASFLNDLLGDEIFLVWEWDGDGDATEVRWFPNNPPTAVDDFYSLDEDTVFAELTAGLLANDSDPDGDELSMVLVNDVQFGVLSYNADGTFTYTPQENFFGTDSFSYKALDGELESNLALVTFTVNPVNDVPQVTLPAAFTIDEGQVFLGSGSFFDPDQDTWTGTVDYGDGSGPLSLSLTTHQSFELFHPYLPSGVYIVTVTIHDGISEGQASSDLIVNNVAPAVSIDSLAGGESSVLVGLEVSLLGSFIDPGADTHTALIAWGDGSLTGIDPAHNPLEANHVYQSPGLYTVTLTVTDDDGGVGTAAATLEVIEPAAAAEVVIDDLDTILLDPALAPEAADVLEEALVDLEGANDGLSTSGALDKIVGGQWNAALVKIEKVIQDLEAAEAADPSLDLSDLKRLLVLIGKSVVLEIIETEQAGGSPVTVIDQAYALVAAGQVLLDGGDYLGAVDKFLDAIHVL